MARQQIKARLLAYFSNRTGLVVNLDEIVREFGDMTPSQVRVGINNLRNSSPETSGGFDMKSSLRVVAHGNAWCWQPVQAANATPPAKSKRCFEEIGGPIKDGSILLQADDGTLWKAVEL